MKKLLKTLQGEKFSTPPIWLMRQAGRYLPEYREIRQQAENFLQLCYNPKLASEITLQPIKRFGFDGAIIFSDILVIPDALGVKVEFAPKKGPILEKIFSEKQLAQLKIDNVEKHLQPVFENIALTKSKIDGNTTLIGFSGSPWTISTYMIEGGGSKNFEQVRAKALAEPIFFKQLIEILVEVISLYLIKQIEAGAEVVKLFDSWAGILPEFEYNRWVLAPNKKIVENVKKHYPHIPIIVFARGSGFLYEKIAEQINCQAVGIDQNISRSWAKEIIQKKHHKIIQGNLDNLLLSSGQNSDLEAEIIDIMRQFADIPFIFNLGHGVLPDTPIDNVERLLKIVRNFS